MNTHLPVKRSDHIKFFMGLTVICICLFIAGHLELKDYEQAEAARKAKQEQIQQRHVFRE